MRILQRDNVPNLILIAFIHMFRKSVPSAVLPQKVRGDRRYSFISLTHHISGSAETLCCELSVQYCCRACPPAHGVCRELLGIWGAIALYWSQRIMLWGSYKLQPLGQSSRDLLVAIRILPEKLEDHLSNSAVAVNHAIEI